MFRKALALATVLSAGPTPLAQANPLAKMFAGQYRVINRDCLGTGNLFNTPAAITVSGSLLTLDLRGAHPYQLHMTDGRSQQALPNGHVVTRSGILFGNGFAYGEEVRNGRFYVSKIEYTMHWEDGKVTLKRVTRVDPRHNAAAYCDLAPLR